MKNKRVITMGTAIHMAMGMGIEQVAQALAGVDLISRGKGRKNHRGGGKPSGAAQAKRVKAARKNKQLRPRSYR